MEGTIVLIIGGVLLYFFPSYIGWKKEARESIFLLNLLLGWTLVGWIAALIWASNSKEVGSKINYTCSYCGYKQTLDQRVNVYVCPQCHREQTFD